MNVTTAPEGKEYIIRGIETDDEDLNAFLFPLGCYSGEPITVAARRKGSCTVSLLATIAKENAVGALITTGAPGAGFAGGLIAVVIMTAIVICLCVNSDKKVQAEYALSGKE